MLGADRHEPPGLASLQVPDSRPRWGAGMRDKEPLAPLGPQSVRRSGWGEGAVTLMLQLYEGTCSRLP